MAWLAVDKDGTEKIFQAEPFRRCNYISHVFIDFLPVHYTKNLRHKWASGWSTDLNDAFPEFCIVLPKGTIKKIIGYNLTWKDEPVEIKN